MLVAQLSAGVEPVVKFCLDGGDNTVPELRLLGDVGQLRELCEFQHRLASPVGVAKAGQGCPWILGCWVVANQLCKRRLLVGGEDCR